ncbi:hypothetical protein AYK20_04150 [Thermoplasmatales archaeon SG8-52-1]|nr:MAG: hypothetical protein AYK20_04150 [Thermoplasmatales archaeon SG8-52-1]
MKQTILIIGIILLLIGASVVSSFSILKEKSYTYSTYLDHDPIYINGNDDFTSENGVTGGSGTSYDPYIIEGWDINASSQNGIILRNVSAKFVIRNCYIHDGGSNYNGIVFFNVTYGVIKNNIITRNRNGTLFASQGYTMKENSTNNKIIQNNITDNIWNGIHFGHTLGNHHDYNSIYLNNISGNNKGIYMVTSRDNFIYSNNIFSNSKYGVELFMCCCGGVDNKVYHNNIINNGDGNGQAFDSSGWNYWDDGYPSGGNFWSDYTGSDANGDGIGDEPYIIPTEEYYWNYDYYPLMEPYGGNLPPFADFFWTPKLPDSNETIIFNASKSIDYDGYITLLQWDWDNDGEYDINTTNPDVTFIFDEAGDYPVTLRIHDNNSLKDTITKTIRVGNQPPNEPIPIYPLNGSINVPHISSLKWSGDDPDGDIVTFDLFFGIISPPPKIVSNQSFTTYYPGGLDDCTVYYWQIVAWDEYGTYTKGPIWSFTTSCKPDPPTITGPTNGKPGKPYSYTFTSALDPEGDDVSYYIDWGDGSTSGWTFFIPSGPPGYSESHSWTSEGNYTIKAKVKDIYSAESNWSEFTVNMPRNKATSNSFFLRFLDHFPLLHRLLDIWRLNLV